MKSLMIAVSGLLRTVAYWVLFAAVTYGSFRVLEVYWPEMSATQLRASIEAAASPFVVFRDKNFAIALSGLIGAAAMGFAAAGLVSVLFVRASLGWNRRKLTSSKDEAAFARNLETIKGRIGRSRWIGHAFQQFSKTIYIQAGSPPVAISTVRPQAFINAASIREQSAALQLMPAISGYFVGIGLLLTFIGLIAALSVAAPSVMAGNAEQAKEALNQLLDAATFKFATSIAGLGGSLFLSVWFRFWMLGVDRGIGRFCEAIEDRMRFVSAQEISREIAETMRLQLTHLENLDGDAFVDRLGSLLGPKISQAMTAAVAPLAANIKESTRDMTGVDFSTRLTEAVESMTRRLGEATDKLSHVVTSFEAAGKIARDDLTNAAKGAGGSMGEAIDLMVGSMKGAIQELSVGVTSLSSKLAAHFEGTENTVRTLRTAAQQASEKALLDIDGKMQEFNTAATARFQTLISDLTSQVSTLSHALQAASQALSQHESNTRESARNVEATASAFGVVARDVRDATRPLADSSSKVADSAQVISKATAEAVQALANGQNASQALASELKDHAERIKTFWASYEARFANVDEQMAMAIKTFGEQLAEQQALIRDYTKDIDDGFTKAVGNLNGAISNLGEQAEGVRDAMEQFAKNVEARSPHT